MSHLEQQYTDHVERAFAAAERGESKLTPDLFQLDGMSGRMTRHFYNNLLNFEDARYLEVGTWKGSSTCAAMYGNHAHVVCIDNWSLFQGPKDEFLRNFERYKGENDARFIEADCFSVDVSSLPRFNVYLYDGDHSEESHYRALTHFYPALDDVFILVVDDWNWADVRDGTHRAIAELGLEVVHTREVRLTQDNRHTPKTLARASWWNGIYITVLRKKHHA